MSEVHTTGRDHDVAMLERVAAIARELVGLAEKRRTTLREVTRELTDAAVSA